MRRVIMALIGAVAMLAAVLVGTAVSASAKSNSDPVEIDSTSGWVNTGFWVKRGQHVRIKAWGNWTVDHRNYHKVGPNGHGPLPIGNDCKVKWDLPYGRLIAKVGDYGKVFSVGTPKGESKSWTAKRTGWLYLSINDKPECSGDNWGAVIAKIHVWGYGNGHHNGGCKWDQDCWDNDYHDNGYQNNYHGLQYLDKPCRRATNWVSPHRPRTTKCKS